MLPLAGFCKHAVWIFGVLVGLALKEAITRVAPHLLSFQAEPGNDIMWVEMLRLSVFGLMIVRHYLGAALLFDHIHSQALTPVALPSADATVAPGESLRLRHASHQFGVDFFAGLLHFTLFSVCSLTIELHHAGGDPLPPEWAFRWALLFVLSYDVFWLIARPGPHPRALKLWTSVNASTAIVCASWYWYLIAKAGWGTLDAEIPPLIAILVVSVMDITHLTTGEEFFSRITIMSVKYIIEKLTKFLHMIDGRPKT